MKLFRILALVTFMLTVPLLVSTSQNGSFLSTSTVYAGHHLSGGWCDCGQLGCICDPGETPGGGAPSQQGKKTENPSNNVDAGTAALFLIAFLAALLAATRGRT